MPEDNDARARYGSSLAFIGKFDSAFEELQTVLSADPDNFHAHAYMAIAYTQMGDNKLALSSGERALELAPTEEARARFSAFYKEIQEKDIQVKQPEPLPGTTRGTPSLPPQFAKVVKFVRGNPVAGPKLVGSEVGEAGVLMLFFRSFPMDQMPPFVKDKFLTSISDKIKSEKLAKVKSVRFLDRESGKEMERIELKK